MGKKNRKRKLKSKSSDKITSIQIFIPDAELDFHEFGVINHFDIEKILNEFLEDSHIAGYSSLLVVVGKGQVVRPTVRQLLSNHKLVSSFKQAGYFNGQDGAFEVLLAS